MHGQAQSHDVGVKVTKLQGRGILREGRDIHAEEIDSELAVDVMQLVAPLAVWIFPIFRINLFQVVEVERALLVHALVDAEELTVFDCHQGMAAERAFQGNRLSGISTGDEGFTADLALIFTTATCIVVKVLVGSATDWADGFLRDGSSVTAIYRFKRLFVLPLVVFDEELPVLFYEGNDDRGLIHRVFLVLWGMGVVISPLFQRNIPADKCKKPCDLLIKRLNSIDEKLYNVHEQLKPFFKVLFWSMTLYRKKGVIALPLCNPQKINDL